MTTRSLLTFLAGSALVLACACAPGVARGPAPLAIQGIEVSPAEQVVERVMLRTAAAERRREYRARARTGYGAGEDPGRPG